MTAGFSSRECLETICAADGKAKHGVNFVLLASIKFSARDADKLPKHLQGIPAVKFGGRGVTWGPREK